MSRYTTILWDVDGTLLDFHYSQREALSQCFQSIGLSMTEEILHRYSEINDSFWKRLELGEITKAQLLNGRFIQLFEELHITNVDVEAFRKKYQEGLGNTYAYIDNSLEICRSLTGRVKQYVVTNGVTATQLNKLKLSGFDEIMEELFISEQIGAPKPQKEFFDYCFSRLEEKDKKKILLIGDSLSSDIKGGVMAGIDTCWYCKDITEEPKEYQPTYKIENLNQVFSLI